jgi:hypothetical protein
VSKNENTCIPGINNLFYSYADNLANPRILTIEQLRTFSGLENISEEIAHQIIDGLYKLTIITYKKFQDGNRTI